MQSLGNITRIPSANNIHLMVLLDRSNIVTVLSREVVQDVAVAAGGVEGVSVAHVCRHPEIGILSTGIDVDDSNRMIPGSTAVAPAMCQ
jgi:hypothetical protein